MDGSMGYSFRCGFGSTDVWEGPSALPQEAQTRKWQSVQAAGRTRGRCSATEIDLDRDYLERKQCGSRHVVLFRFLPDLVSQFKDELYRLYAGLPVILFLAVRQV